MKRVATGLLAMGVLVAMVSIARADQHNVRWATYGPNDNVQITEVHHHGYYGGHHEHYYPGSCAPWVAAPRVYVYPTPSVVVPPVVYPPAYYPVPGTYYYGYPGYLQLQAPGVSLGIGL